MGLRRCGPLTLLRERAAITGRGGTVLVVAAFEFTALLSGRLRGFDQTDEQVDVEACFSPDTAHLRLSSGDEIRTRHGSFAQAAVWLTGVVQGEWHTARGEVIDRLAISADEDVTRIACGDFSRTLVVETEPLQEALIAAQPRHATVRMMPPFYGAEEEPADIDLGLAELIAQLWGLGAITSGACENQDGLAYIAFEDAGSAERFLEAVANYARPERPDQVDDESLYNRVSLFSDTEPDDWQTYRKRRQWRLKAMVQEFGMLRDGPDQFAEGSEFVIGITVLFPTTDIDVALKAVRATNAAARREVSVDTYLVRAASGYGSDSKR